MSTWAGISHWGNYGVITGNYVTVTQGNGIGGSWSNEVVTSNYVTIHRSVEHGVRHVPGRRRPREHHHREHPGRELLLRHVHAVQPKVVVIGNTFTTFNGLQVAGTGYNIVIGNNFNVANIPLVGTPGTNTQIFGNMGGSGGWGRTLFPASAASGASLNIPPGVGPVCA